MGLSALVLPAPAGADAPGTVKIVVNNQELVKQPGNVDNDPHVDCGFDIVFNGFDSLQGQAVTANIQIQSPSSPVDQSIFLKSGTINSSGYLDIPVTAGMLNFLGTVANHTENGNNDSEKIDTADPNELTYHVTLDTSTTVSGDKIAKQKTFWIGGCEASPAIATAVSDEGSGTIGATFTDTATLSHSSTTAPTGTVTFQAFDNSHCTGAAVFTSVKPISGTSVTSDGFTPPSVGTYYWVASYSGDANNNPVAGSCGDAGETLVVNQATPGVVTSVSTAPDSTATAPAYVDTATVTGYHPTGTVTFNAWTNSSCSGGPVFTSAGRPLGSNGTATSAEFVPTPPATSTTYFFIASYSGDTNNAAVSGHCTDAGESITFTPGATQSAITTQESAASAPDTFTDTATVTGGTGTNAPTGQVTFQVYGPNDANCTGPFVTISPSSPLAANGTATSGPFTAPSAGTYTFIASYSGDAHNTPAAGTCSSAHESFVVEKARPAISTTEMASTTTPGSFTDTATLTGVATGHTPAGTMTFRVYGPNDATCTGTAVTLTPASTVTGTSTTSGLFTPPGPGTYTFVASYSGDAFNSAVAGHCSDANERFTVASPPPVVIPPTVIVPVVLPSTAVPAVTIVKTNDAGGNPFAKTNQAKAPSDPVDFQAVITNTSSEAETITSITDSYGTVVNTPECASLIGTSLAPGASVSCGFTIPGYAPAAGDSVTDTVSVAVRDTSGQTANASDTSTVNTPAPAVESTGGATQQSNQPPTVVTPPPVVLATPAPIPTAVSPLTGARTLPFTGANVWSTFLTGVGLLLMGLVLWLKTYRVPGAKHYA